MAGKVKGFHYTGNSQWNVTKCGTIINDDRMIKDH